ncbi:MAG: DoxX family protein [Candidatus Acidiferrum sp.]
MNASLAKFSVPLLRWTLGFAVIVESCRFVFSSSAAHFFAKTGLPHWLRPAFGGAELIAAVLFLIPSAARLGSYLLLVIFGVAALVHLLHGQFGVEGLVVYAAGVLVCTAHESNKTAEDRYSGT